MIYRVTVPGELPGMNEIIKASKYSPYAYSDMKRTNTNLCTLTVRKLPQLDRIRLKITYICKNRRRDPDNIAVAKKFILDGLVRANVIKNDGWKEIAGWEEYFEVDKKNPRIEIEIEEVKNEG